MPRPVVIEEFSQLVPARRYRHQQSAARQPDQLPYATPTRRFDVDYGFDAAPFFGLGIGYDFNDWLRFDVTGEYRGRVEFPRLGNLSPAAPATPPTNTRAASRNGCSCQRLCRSRHLELLHAVRRRRHRRLAQHHSQLPGRLHACSGVRRRRLRRHRSRNGISPGRCTPVSPTRSSKNFTVELAYRYLDLGMRSPAPRTPIGG